VTPAFEIRVITAEETIPLRHAILRAGLPRETAVFPGDEADSSRHFGAFADGQLVGNHSYHHDYWRWLDPRYPELDRTQDAFKRQLGACPAFFRPPHGQRTPFMLAHASSNDMHTVTWDVSASDWTLHDGAEVAVFIAERARHFVD